MKAYIDGEAILTDVQYIGRLKNINKELLQDFEEYVSRLVQEANDKFLDRIMDIELIEQALDFYVNAQEEFVSYDEHMDLVKRVNRIKKEIGLLDYYDDDTRDNE